MMNSNKHTDVSLASQRKNRAGALLTAAAGAIVALMATSAACGQTTMPSDNAPATQPSMAAEGVESDGAVHLTAGKSTIVKFKKMFSTVNVSDPDVVKDNLISPYAVLLTGKKPGTTALIVLDDEKHSQVINISVDPDLGMFTRQLKLAYPSLDIAVTPLNDSIALRGHVPSMEVAEQVVEMASTYGKVHNFLDISGGQQILLQVRFAEVSKSAMRNLGVTFGGTDGVSSLATNGLTQAGLAFSGASPALTTANAAAASGVTFFGQGRFGVVAFDYFISAMRTNGLVRVLAEPNLTATSGQTASFLAGGQVPIPVPQPGSGGSTVTIEYHDFGVKLNFTPQVLGNGKIKLKVSPEVSDLDYSDAVTVGGTSVPGFTDNKVDTTVELGDGQSFALAGLLNNKVSANNSAIPVLGDLPILGALFRSVTYQRNESELVVLVTPRLVAAMNPDAVPTLPGEHWRYPTQEQLYLRQDLGGPIFEPGKTRADTKTAGMPPQFHGTYGFTAAGIGSVAAVDTH